MFVTIATASATPMNPHHRGAYAFHHHREEDPPGRRAELWVPSELADEAFTAAGRERAWTAVTGTTRTSSARPDSMVIVAACPSRP
jgi:hypothetical protein